MLSQTDVKRLFSYTPENGILIWLTGKRKGKIAGSIDKANGYVRIGINGDDYYAHRIIWLYATGVWPKIQVDHKDHDRANNMWSNLREVTVPEQSQNRMMPKNNTSRVVGVHKTRYKWRAEIGGKNYILLGYFYNYFDAVCARKSAENRLAYHPNHGKRERTVRGRVLAPLPPDT